MIENTEKVGESSVVDTEQDVLVQMPSFEEHMNLLDVQEEGEREAERIMPDDVMSDVAEMAENSEAKAELAEKAPENISAIYERDDDIINRRQVATGEKSALYSVEKVDGKTSTQIESEYFNTANEFSDAHDELKNNAGLRLAISGLSMDLALVDATNGKNFEDGDEKQRAALLEDYSVLRSRLDSPETSDAEKMLITEYFGAVGGAALSFLENHYIPESDKTNDAEQDKDKKEFDERLSEIEEELELTKNEFLESSAALDQILQQIDEPMKVHSVDIDEVRIQLGNLSKANNNLAEKMAKFVEQTIDYENFLAEGQEHLDSEDYVNRLHEATENEMSALEAARKVDDADGRTVQLQRFIMAANELSA